MHVQIIHHSQRDAWRFFPAFKERVWEFCQTWDSDVNFPVLEQFMRMNFVSDNPTMLMFVGVDDDGIVMGHCLAMSENWMGNCVVTIVQLQADSIVPQEVWDQGMSEIRQFARKHRATYLQLAARTPAVARLFRKYGFATVRTLMRQPVEGHAPLTTS